MYYSLLTLHTRNTLKCLFIISMVWAASMWTDSLCGFHTSKEISFISYLIGFFGYKFLQNRTYEQHIKDRHLECKINMIKNMELLITIKHSVFFANILYIYDFEWYRGFNNSMYLDKKCLQKWLWTRVAVNCRSSI